MPFSSLFGSAIAVFLLVFPPIVVVVDVVVLVVVILVVVLVSDHCPCHRLMAMC